MTWRGDQVLYDALLSAWRRPVAADIVIVAIDDASLAAIGRWPWRRAVHATLIDMLAQARPRAIGLDLLLSEPDPDPQQDAVLAQALRRAGNVVLPTHFVSVPTQPPRELAPIAPLRDAVRLAHVDPAPDADGVVRHAFLRAGLAGQLRPHMALALLETAGERVHPAIVPAAAGARAEPDNAAWQRDERVRIKYAGPPGTVRAIPYASLLRGDVDARTLRDRIVLIGATATGLGDSLPVPASGRAGPMSGVEMTAQLLDALRGGHGLRAVPDALVGALAAVLALALFAAFARATARRALVIAAAAIVAAPLASLLLLGAGWWLAPGALMLTAAIAYPIWSWRRLEAANRFLDDELVQLSGEPAVPRTLPPATLEPLSDPLDQRLTAVHEAAEHVRASRRFVADSLAALPEAVFVTDEAFRVLIANARAAALLGAAGPDALVGQPVDRLLAPLAPLESVDWRALCEAALAATASMASRARHGDHGEYLARLAPLGGGPARGLVISVADVTRLTAAERGREELLAFISHDLRSPQASLVSLVDLHRLGAMKMTIEELIGHIDRLAHRTLAMADDFLQLVRAESKDLTIEDFDFARAVEEALAEVAPQAQAGRLTIARGRFDTGLPVRGEVQLVRRACVNLLSNAIKFSPPDERIDVSVTATPTRCVLTVGDHGPGIAPDAVARLFRKYERGQPPRSSRVMEGIGLGLAFVDAVARRHGGEVTVDSAPGQGSRFELCLPRADAAR